MLVILAIAALAILACVVLVSLGRGGELTEFPPDVPPLDLPEPGQLTAVDFMALHLPVNLVGYHTQSVDETLRRAASAISARDTRIAVLEQRVSELLSSRLHARQEVYAAPGGGLRTDHEPEAPAAPMRLPEAGDPMPSFDPAALAPFAAGPERPARNGDATATPEPTSPFAPPDTSAGLSGVPDAPAGLSGVPADNAPHVSVGLSGVPADVPDSPADEVPDGAAGPWDTRVDVPEAPAEGGVPDVSGSGARNGDAGDSRGAVPGDEASRGEGDERS
ncbi:hypothetical protein [Nonomuraea sp. NPDC048916]|uniref:hypothetical protein n=1 Tax=Nonomuraea sp. NPDC048916 TaxID=3154232 RepID=UPI0033FD8810